MYQVGQSHKKQKCSDGCRQCSSGPLQHQEPARHLALSCPVAKSHGPTEQSHCAEGVTDLGEHSSWYWGCTLLPHTYLLIRQEGKEAKDQCDGKQERRLSKGVGIPVGFRKHKFLMDQVHIKPQDHMNFILPSAFKQSLHIRLTWSATNTNSAMCQYATR